MFGWTFVKFIITDKHDGHLEALQFRIPFLHDVLECAAAFQREAQYEDARLMYECDQHQINKGSLRRRTRNRHRHTHLFVNHLPDALVLLLAGGVVQFQQVLLIVQLQLHLLLVVAGTKRMGAGGCRRKKMQCNYLHTLDSHCLDKLQAIGEWAMCVGGGDLTRLISSLCYGAYLQGFVVTTTLRLLCTSICLRTVEIIFSEIDFRICPKALHTQR